MGFGRTEGAKVVATGLVAGLLTGEAGGALWAGPVATTAGRAGAADSVGAAVGVSRTVDAAISGCGGAVEASELNGLVCVPAISVGTGAGAGSGADTGAGAGVGAGTGTGATATAWVGAVGGAVREKTAQITAASRGNSNQTRRLGRVAVGPPLRGPTVSRILWSWVPVPALNRLGRAEPLDADPFWFPVVPTGVSPLVISSRVATERPVVETILAYSRTRISGGRPTGNRSKYCLWT